MIDREVGVEPVQQLAAGRWLCVEAVVGDSTSKAADSYNCPHDLPAMSWSKDRAAKGGVR
jgi:hypothetical protein